MYYSFFRVYHGMYHPIDIDIHLDNFLAAGHHLLPRLVYILKVYKLSIVQGIVKGM